MKRVISLLVISILIIEIILTSIGHNYVFADDLNNRKHTFDDISGHWCQEFIEKFSDRNWVFGYDDGLFYPDQYVTRAEFTSMVVNIFKKTTRQIDNTFTDVSKNDWFYKAVTYAAGENLIKGYEDGTFKPYNNISRQDAAVLTTKLFDVDFFTGAADFKFKDEDTFPKYSYKSIKDLASHEIVKGYPDKTFRPFNLITRAEAVKMLDVVLKYVEIPDEIIPDAPAATVTVSNTPKPTSISTPKPIKNNNSGGSSEHKRTPTPTSPIPTYVLTPTPTLTSTPVPTSIPTPTATGGEKDNMSVSMDVYGELKQNRTVVFSVYAVLLSDEHPIIEELTEWDFEPVLGGINQTDIKTDALNSTATKKSVLFKEPGDYKITARVSNNINTAKVEKIITISPDERPVADFEVKQTYFRDGNYAKIELRDKSYSSDNDYIKQRIWKVKWDSNNDGDFKDDQFEVISNLNEVNPVYKTDRVGRYQVELEVVEGFVGFSNLIDESDYQRADTSLKAAELKIFTVDNAAPQVSFNIERKKKLDAVFTVGKADTEKVNRYSKYIKSFAKKMSDAGIDANISTIDTQTYTTTNTFDWQEYDHYNYADRYNNPSWPNPMEKHILFDGKDIQMVGYTVTAMKDFLFVPDNNKTQKTFTFDIKRDSTNWHSIEGGGFLFNASIENNILKGYCILITQNGLVLDEIPGINLTMFRDGKYNLVENAGKKLATYNIGDVYANHNWKIVIDPESITLWDNGNLVIDNFKLPNTGYGSGFGPITSHGGHGCSQMSYFTFKNIEMTTIVGKSLSQALEEFDWREGAQHLLVNLSDELLFELNTDEKIAYIASKMLEEDVDLYALGNEGNRGQYEAAITGTAGKGVVTFNDDLDAAMGSLEEFVIGKFADGDFVVKDYIIQEDEVVYSTSYYDIENDPEYDAQWNYIHHPDVFENSQGLSVFNSVYMAQPITLFDKIGEYTIQFKMRDNPVGEDDSFDEYRRWSDEKLSQKKIAVHRLPSAVLEAKVYLNEDKDGCNVRITETAMDLDHQSDLDSGIISREYKWKNIKDKDWTYGDLPQKLPLDNYYIFVLTVKDKEGAASKPAVQMISTKIDGEEIEPPLDTVNPKITLSLSKSAVVVGETVVLTANMSDNIGIAYTKATIDGIPAYFDTKGICLYDTDKVGEIVIRVEAYDAAGNTASAEKTLTVRADMPPTVSVSAPDKVAVDETFTITVNATDDVGVTLIEAEVDGVPVVLDSARRYTMTALSLGEIVVTAKAHDKEGKIGSFTKTITVTTDTTAPAVTISSTANTVAVGQSFTITVKATDNVGVTKIEAEVDGKAITLDSNLKYTTVAESIGKITVKAFAHDKEGNVGVAEREITVTEDTNPPSVSISSTATTVVTNQAFTITVNASDNVGVTRVEAEADGVPLVLDENRKCTIVPEKTGVITIKAYAYDSKDNMGTAERKITVNADTTAPSVSISATASTIIEGKPVTITINASDNAQVTRIEAEADGVPLVLDENRKCTIILEKPGTLVITAKAYDAADNIGTATRNITVQADTSAPSVSISSTASRVAAGSPFTITVNASDNVGVAAIETYFDGIPVTLDENNQYTHIPKKEGTIVIIAKAYDKAGNVREAQRTVTVTADTIKPVVTLTVDKDEVNTGESVSFTATATDNVGIAKIEAFFEEKEIILDGDGNATFIPAQSGRIIVNAYDHKGNKGTTEKAITVIETIEPEDDYERPVVQLEMSSNVVSVGDTVTIRVTATDNIRVKSVQAEVYGTPVLLDNTGIGTFTLDKAGMFEVVAKAYDVYGNEGYASSELLVKDAGDTTPPEGSIKSPEDNSKMFSPIDIIGTAYDEKLAKYVLEYSEKGKNQYTKFAEGATNVKDGILGKLDSTMMRNGQYDIRLSVYDEGGYLATYVVTYIIEGEQKVGNFSMTFADFTAPVEGIPITIERTYDSRNKSQGDFGYGWTLGTNDIRIQENVVPGEKWDLKSSGSGFSLRYDLIEVKKHNITVTYPDGNVERFGIKLSPSSQQFAPIQQTTVSFVPEEGTLSKLEALDVSNTCMVMGNTDGYDGLFDYDLNVYNPTRYKLTKKDGTILEISETQGLENMTDTNGNKVIFGRDGILNTTGKSITYARDDRGRITKITDAMGNEIKYQYDGYGDLISVTDQEGNITSFKYNFSHGIIDIIDPRGVKVARNEYDDNGKLIANIDAEGNRIEYTHDTANNQEIIKDRLGNVTLISYDESGNVLSKTDPMGNTMSYTYDSKGNKLSEKNAVGNITTYSYDINNNVTSVTDALGNKTEYTYDTAGRKLTEKDPLGNISTNVYNSSGNLTESKDKKGNTTYYTYDSRGNLLTYTNVKGQKTVYTYDSNGNVLTQTDVEGNVTSFTYDSNGNQITKSITRKISSGTETLTTMNQYDSLNRVIKTIQPDGRVTTVEYNTIGKESFSTDAEGRKTQYEYDVFGNLIKVRYPDGIEENRTYDKEGRELTQTDRVGNITTFVYDKAGRMVKTIFADGSTSETEYNGAGQVTKKIDENGNITKYNYDEAGRNTEIIDALGNITRFEYDKNGNKVKMIDAKGRENRYVYDENRLLIKTVFPDNTFTSYTYDALGNKLTETNQDGKTICYEYDVLGHVVKVTDALGNTTEYSYNAAGNMLAQKDANGWETKFEYDSLGRRIKRSLPLGMTEAFNYGSNDNVLSHTSFNGDITTYNYDDADRLLKKNYPNGSYEEYTYDVLGRKIAVFDSSIGTTSFEYNAKSKLVKQINPDGTELSYTYDAVGNRTSVKVPSGTTKYSYDALNRLSKVTAPDGKFTTYTYDAVGNRETVTYPNGNVMTYTYDDLNRLINQVNKKADGTIISSYEYTLGLAGNRTKVVENTGRTVEYQYDDTYKLVKEKITFNGSVSEISYTYDAVGNRLEKNDNGAVTTYTYDANDRLLTEGGKNYTYDKNGNTLSVVGEGQNITYKYDYNNRMISLNDGTNITLYEYDADGNRVSKSVNGNKTYYVVDRNRDYTQVLEERNSTGLVVSFIYGDDLISQQRSGVESYYIYDGHGSTSLLTNAQGNVTDTYTYDAFGILLDKTGNTINDYLYTGEQYDANAGFYYLRARYMNPATGRFFTMDSYEGSVFDPVSIHKYLYANVNPVMYSDPSGYFSLAEISTVQSMTGTLSRMLSFTSRVFEIYDKATMVVDVLNYASTAYNLISALSSPAPDIAIMNEIKSAFGVSDVATLLNGFEQAYSTIGSNWRNDFKHISDEIPNIALQSSKFIASRMPSLVKAQKMGNLRFVIYAPSSPFGGYTDTPIVLNKKLQVNISPGGGRLFGIGIKIGSNQDEQILRIDYWDVHNAPFSKRYHYHVAPNLKTHNYF